MSVISWLKGLFRKVISTENIEKAFDVTIATSQQMLDAQELWRNVYAGYAPWNNEDVPSLFTAASICSRIAKICDLEKEWDINGSAMADFMKAQFKPFMDGTKNGLRHALEKGCKGGKLLFFPAQRGDRILINTFENNYYYPINYDEYGKLADVILKSQAEKDNYVYTLLSRYNYIQGNGEASRIEITNKVFKTRMNGNGTTLGVEANLSDVEEWAGLQPEMFISNVTRPWFVEFIMPQNNHIEENSYDGVSIFSKAIDLIRKLDEQKARTEWEYEGGELAVDVPVDMWRDIGKKDALNPRNGEVILEVPKGKERLFRNTGIESANLMPTTFNPAFRNESLEAGSNAIKRDIEIVCELAFGTISDAAIQARTATEIESTQVVTFSTISDIQQAMKAALREVAEIVREMAYTYDFAPWSEYEFTLTWGDGIPEDDDVTLDRLVKRLTALMTAASSRYIEPKIVNAFIMKHIEVLGELTQEDLEKAAEYMPGAFEGGEE